MREPVTTESAHRLLLSLEKKVEVLRQNVSSELEAAERMLAFARRLREFCKASAQ